MKRSGFTMIELIFVIVILGILAAVAIPKLAATRDDAKIAAMATNVNQIVSDAVAKYTATGELNVTNAAQWDEVTNVSPAGGDFVYAANVVQYVNKATTNQCGTITYSGIGSNPATLVTQATNVTDPICQGVNARMGLTATSGQDSNISVALGGSSVTF